jgi:hypothetical protein
LTTALPKPEKPAPAPRRRIAASPACACGDAFLRHFRRGSILPANCQRKGCDCDGYQRPARSSVLRSPAEPKCDDCRHQKAGHRLLNRIFSDGCDKCGCLHYTPARPRKLTTARASVARKSAPARTKRPRKQRKGKRASLARQCDVLAGKIVRAKGQCEGCTVYAKSEGAVMQWAHGFSRRYRAIRWNLLNGFCLCSGCHWRWTNDPLAFDEWLRKQWGQPVYDELRAIALKNEKQDMPAVLAKLKAEAAARGIE